jgi:hypothetical protein
MLFRDTGGGPEVHAVRREVHARARVLLAELIGSLSETPIPSREREPLAELMSMGMASLVLWWMDHPDADRDAVVDAMTRVWVGLLVTRAPASSASSWPVREASAPGIERPPRGSG